MTLDVRPQLRSGREPFSTIMQAVSSLKEGQELLLIAPFEPVPLYGVMAQRGFIAQTKMRNDGDWEVLFSPCAEPGPAPIDRPSCPAWPRTAVEVDVRGLEPPEPMVKILEAVAVLPKGAELRAYTDRRPLHLYAQLEERGFSGESTEQPDGSFLTLIRSKADS